MSRAVQTIERRLEDLVDSPGFHRVARRLLQLQTLSTEKKPEHGALHRHIIDSLQIKGFISRSGATTGKLRFSYLDVDRTVTVAFLQNADPHHSILEPAQEMRTGRIST